MQTNSVPMPPSSGHAAHPADEHVVQFYETDEFLCDAVTQYLSAGLNAGEPLVVIATESHRRAFCDRLASRGVDVRHARESGRLTLLDARETLSKFMVDGAPDWDRFKMHVGALIEGRLADDGGRLRAYGEMVDLLWKDGNHQAAIRLEEMWNDLAGLYPFSLLCAYVMGNFLKGSHDEQLRQISARHERVLPTEHHAHDGNGDVAMLQQRSRALESEIAQRKQLEGGLREALAAGRRAEDALRQSQQDLTDFVENAAEGLHWVDADGTIRWANRAELNLLGYAKDEYVGHHISEFHADRAAIEDILARLSRNETLTNYEARLKAKDGAIKDVLIHSNVLFRHGKFIHTRCFTRDITERKSLEAKLRQQNEELRLEHARLEATAAELAGAREGERLARLEAESAASAMTTQNRIAKLLNETQLDVEKLVQTLTDEATALVGASFGAFFYTQTNENGEAFLLYTLSGAPKEAFSKFGVPRNTKVFAPTFAGEGIFRSDDIRKDPRYGQNAPHHGMPKGHLPVASYLAVPVVSRAGKVLGGLFFGHPEPARFTEKHEQLLAGVAAHAAIALDNAQLHRKTRENEEDQARRARQAAMAAEIGSAFTKGGALRQILEASCQRVVRHLDAAFARVWTVDSAGTTLELQASAGTYTHIDGGHARVPVGKFKIGLVAQERLPHLTNDVLNDPRLSDLEWAKREGMIAFAGYPLLVENKLVGVFALFAKHHLSADTLDSLAVISDMLAVGIERKRCEALAEQEARRIAQLQAVTAALSKALSPTEVADAIVVNGRESLGASAAVIYVSTKDGHLELAAHRGLPSVERWTRFPLDAPLPIAVAVRTGEPVWVRDRTSLLAAYPHLEQTDIPSSELESVAALPLKLHGRVLGGMAFSFPRQSTFDFPEKELFSSIALQSAQALERANLFEAECQAREKLTETVRLNELLAGVLAHDLRNPLSAIITAAQLAMMRDEGDHVSKPLRRVLSSGERMTRMIEQLLDFTRVRVGGGLELDPKPADLGELCRQVLNEVEDGNPEWRVHFARTGDTAGVWDADRLMQVFSNLAGNAVQHGDPSGGLQVQVDGSGQAEVVVTLKNHGLIPEGLLPELFDPFRGVQPRRNGGTRGLGLGLFITKQIVLAHGGEVDVLSSAETGTMFLVRLPRRTRPAEPQENSTEARGTTAFPSLAGGARR